CLTRGRPPVLKDSMSCQQFGAKDGRSRRAKQAAIFALCQPNDDTNIGRQGMAALGRWSHYWGRMIEQRRFAGRKNAWIPIAIAKSLALSLLCLTQFDLGAASRTISISAGNAGGEDIQTALDGLPAD